MKSHHCRHCGDTRDKIRPSLRRWKLEDVLSNIRTMVLARREYDDYKYRYITVEEVVTKLRAKRSLVDQCFAKLNLEGLLSQGINQPPHDSTRDRYGNDSAWCATLYMIIKKEKEDGKEESS